MALRFLAIPISRDSDIGAESDTDSFPPARYVDRLLDRP
jgi:hypothetical protein